MGKGLTAMISEARMEYAKAISAQIVLNWAGLSLPMRSRRAASDSSTSPLEERFSLSAGGAGQESF